MDEEIKVKSLYKAIKLLDYFTIEDPELGVTELANLSGIGKSSVFNIVSTLVQCRFLKKDERTSRYSLGAKLLQLSNNFYQTNNMKKIIRPFMEKLSQLSGELVYLGTLFESEVLYQEAIYPNGSFSGQSIIGYHAPTYCTGLGKALLYTLPDNQVEEIIDSKLVKFTGNTITDKDELLKDLEVSRQRGYAIDNMEHEYGIKCVALPIRNYANEVLAALSISGPSLRFTDEKIKLYSEALIESSRQLMEILR